MKKSGEEITPELNECGCQLEPRELPDFLHSSITNSRFDLIFVSPQNNYAEYYLYDPGSLFGYNFDEELTVLFEENKWFSYYGGNRFWEEQFFVLVS